MAFASKSGCPMCGIVARGRGLSLSTSTTSNSNGDAPLSPSLSPASGSASGSSRSAGRTGRNSNRKQADEDREPEIVYRDDNFTVYRERAYPVSSKAHLVIVFNLHVPSFYMLSPSDVPLLIALRDLAHRFLTQLTAPPPSSPGLMSSPATFSPPPARSSSNSSLTTAGGTPFSPLPPSALSPPPPSSASSFTPFTTATAGQQQRAPLAGADPRTQFRVGFITPPWSDSRIPVRDHLHAHAYALPADRCGWWRGVAYGPLAWYPVEDLIAEIREDSSNNRVKSGYASGRGPAPIDRVPDAGARAGTADGHETTGASLASLAAGVVEDDLEAGHRGSDSSSSGGGGGGGGSRPGGSGSSAASTTPSSSNALRIRAPAPPSPARLASPSQIDLDLGSPGSGWSSSAEGYGGGAGTGARQDAALLSARSP